MTAVSGLWAPIRLGRDLDGRAVYLPPLVFQTLAAGGAPRSGKSGVLNAIIAAGVHAHLASHEHLVPAVHIRVLDGKDVEMGGWQGAVQELVGADHHGGVAALENAVDHMRTRANVLREAGRRKVSWQHQDPLCLVVVDEVGFYMASGNKELDRRASLALEALVSRGPAAGMITVVANQRMGVDQIPAHIRDQIGLRWAGRCLTPDTSDTILGRGMAAAGYNAALIDNTIPGLGYLLSEGNIPVLMRVDFLGDEAIERIASRARKSHRGAFEDGGQQA